MFVFVFWNKIVCLCLFFGILFCVCACFLEQNLKLLLGKRCPVKLCVCACFLEQNCVFVFSLEQDFEASARQAMSCETLCLCLFFGTKL